MFSYSSAIAACSRSRRWQHSLELFARMKRERVRPNTYTFAAVAKACATGRLWEEALVLLADMKRASVRPNNIVCCKCVCDW